MKPEKRSKAELEATSAELWKQSEEALAKAEALVDEDPDASMREAFEAGFLALNAAGLPFGGFIARPVGIQATAHYDPDQEPMDPDDPESPTGITFKRREIMMDGATKEDARAGIQQARLIIKQAKELKAAMESLPKAKPRKRKSD